MRRECRQLLEDMRDAGREIIRFTDGKSLDDYLANQQLRWSVERGYEIVVEALSQLRKLDSELAERIRDYRKIISFRNVLIHGYAQVNHGITWDIVQYDLPILMKEPEEMLAE